MPACGMQWRCSATTARCGWPGPLSTLLGGRRQSGAARVLVASDALTRGIDVRFNV